MKYLVKYGLVGVVATLIHVVIATLLIYLYSIDIIFANWLAFSVAFFFSYIGNTKLVFEQKVKQSNFKRFLLVSMITLFIITNISYIGKNYQINEYVIIFIISIIIPAITFILHKTWTFKENI